MRLSLPVSRRFLCVVLGAPEYYGARGRPRVPQDLIEHECLGYRFPTAKTVYRWQSWRNGREFSVNAAGSIVVNHLSKIALAASGVGLAYTADLIAGHELRKGALETVLDHYCMKSQGLFLYFPSKSQNQPKLRAFIDFATGSLRR
jgi:DNA-binding transcriptional LysR family regulator